MTAFQKMFEIIFDNLYNDVEGRANIILMMFLMKRNPDGGSNNPDAESDLDIMKSIMSLLLERLKIVNPQAIWQIMQLENQVA